MKAEILAWSIPLALWLSGIAFYVLSRLGFNSWCWSVAFGLIGTGYGLTTIDVPSWPYAKPLFEDLVFLLGAAATAAALPHRLSSMSRWRVQAVIIAVSLLAAALSLSAARSVRLETIAVQLGCTLLVIVSLLRMAKAPLSRGDRLLFVSFSLVCAMLLLQCVAYLLAEDTGPDITAWRDSTSGFMFQLTGGAIGVVLTFSILLALSLDVIERLGLAAVTDGLTGVLNRRGFEDGCERLAKRYAGRSDLVLMMIDLDHFKKINDTFGHETGDMVIRHMAHRLRDVAGSGGYVGRVGGEEFALMLPGADLDESVAMANALRLEFSRADWPFDRTTFTPTASFGVTLVLPEESFAESMARADALLYLAKRSGRDCVMYRDPQVPSAASAKDIDIDLFDRADTAIR